MTIILAALCAAIHAQGSKRVETKLLGSSPVYHELSIGGTAATSGILQTLTFGSNDASKIKSYFNPGGGLQINYALHFNESVSLSLGLAAKYLQNTYGFDIANESSVRKYVVNSSDENFLFNAKIEDYRETHRALYVQIPLLFGYETPHPLARWYLNIGAAAQFAVWKNYSAKIGKASTEGHSEFLNGTLRNENDLPHLGIGIAENISVSGKQNLKFTVNGYIETGIKISVGKKSWLYIGAFGEISALKNSVAEAQGSGSEYLINYLPNKYSNTLTDHWAISSITNTKYSSGGRTYALGGIIRIGFDFRSSNRMLSNPVRELE
jgi:hypothetical protein